MVLLNASELAPGGLYLVRIENTMTSCLPKQSAPITLLHRLAPSAGRLTSGDSEASTAFLADQRGKA